MKNIVIKFLRLVYLVAGELQQDALASLVPSLAPERRSNLNPTRERGDADWTRGVPRSRVGLGYAVRTQVSELRTTTITGPLLACVGSDHNPTRERGTPRKPRDTAQAVMRGVPRSRVGLGLIAGCANG